MGKRHVFLTLAFEDDNNARQIELVLSERAANRLGEALISVRSAWGGILTWLTVLTEIRNACRQRSVPIVGGIFWRRRSSNRQNKA